MQGPIADLVPDDVVRQDLGVFLRRAAVERLECPADEGGIRVIFAGHPVDPPARCARTDAATRGAGPPAYAAHQACLGAAWTRCAQLAHAAQAVHLMPVF